MICGCIFLSSVNLVRADWRDEIGYTRLLLLAGPELPVVPSQGFAQIEARENSVNFLPDTSSSLFSGKTFTLKSGSSGVSGHANLVANHFYGDPSSLVRGNCPVDLYNADDWIGAGFLNLSSSSKPLVELRDVQNHSWIATLDANFTEAVATEADYRLDYAINRDGFSSVVGVNNGNSTVLPALLGQSYHTISVGLVNGNHSAGFTTLDGSGRIKPDIVAPDEFTSFATPMVASAAGLLTAKLAAPPYSLTGADKPRVVKALLLASATKNTVAAWSNSSSRPLDLRYGAGELNIYHAYQALRAGRGNASNTTLLNPRGWAAETVSANSSKTYFFSIAAGAPATPFSAVLTWHRLLSQHGSNPWLATLNDLNLRLYQASGFSLGSQVTESLSQVDNVELVNQTALPPGSYALVVENNSSTATPYALAWHSLPAVTVVATLATAREIDGHAGQITFTRSGNTTLALFVPLTVSGSAIPNTHFQALPSSVTFAAGQATATLSVIPISDNLAQGDRSVNVAVAADFASVFDPAQTATVTIEDKPFDRWRFANFTSLELGNPAISGENADPDSDQLVNLIEYALNLAPKSPEISPVTKLASGVYLALSAAKNPAASDLVWGAEVSSDLITWQSALITDQTLNFFEARDSVMMSASARRFIRLKITRL